MSDMGFPFIDMPTVKAKPRLSRWTILSDRGIPIQEQNGIMEMIHDVVDRMKNVDHVGLLKRHSADLIARKNAIYREWGIGVFPGGVPFEVAYLQGKSQQYFHRLLELGFSGVEISADCIPPIPVREREHLIREASGLGLEVFTEVGYKRVGDEFGKDSLAVRAAVEGILTDLNAGATKVTIESNELTNYIAAGELDRLISIVNEVGLEKIVFEIGAGGKVNAELGTWLLENFGSEINVENIEIDRLLHFEAMRHGLSRAGNFQYFTRSNNPTGALASKLD